ncbi:MAG: TetR/AcrR family transcriptional regulator, partial [Conexibacter sp.]|nr:TetR/AcrR family transcriptional regulator [Conexibacter sp.]
MTTPKATRLPPDERREQLVALGLELLGRTPPDQVSIEAIARAAGISKGLLYHYFPTKSDFVVAVLRQSRDELERRMAPDLSVEMTAGERLDASIDAFLGYVQEHAAGFLAVTHARAGDDPAIRTVLEQQRADRVDTMVDFAAALAGAPREELASPALAVVLEGWLFFCDGVVSGWLARGEGELSRAEVLHLLRENLLASLGSVAGTDPRPAATRLAQA